MAGLQAPDLLDRVLDYHGDALFDFALAVTDRTEVAVEAVREALPAAVEAHGPAVSRAALLGSVLEVALRRAQAEPASGLPSGLLDPEWGSSPDELARLSWDATRALGPRARGILDLSLRQGLAGEALSEALGVTPGQASATTQEALAQAERLVGAVLLTHLARDDCDGLAAVLESLPTDAGADRLSAEVDGHRQACAACDDRLRSLVPVPTLLAAAPATPAPPELRQVRLSRPVPSDGPAPRRWGRAALALAATAVVVAASAFLLTRQEGGGGEGAEATIAGGRLALDQEEVVLGPLDQKGSFTLTNSGAEVLDYRVEPGAPWLEVAGREGRIAPGSSAVLTVAVDRSRAPEGEAASELRVTSSGGSAVLPIHAAVERAPVLAEMEASPQPVVPVDCPGATPARVRVTVVEESGLAHVQLNWRTRDGIHRTLDMAREDPSWSASLGPFDRSGNVAWWVRATDIRGNTTLSATQTLAVVAC